jgi:hypothetical protein
MGLNWVGRGSHATASGHRVQQDRLTRTQTSGVSRTASADGPDRTPTRMQTWTRWPLAVASIIFQM